MKEYNSILFDLDGTLTDPKEGITKSVAHALGWFQIAVEDLDTLCKFIGPPLKDSFMEYYGFTSEDATIAIEKYRDYFEIKGIFENKVYPGIVSLLRTLKESGKQLFVATSKPEVFARRILEHFQLETYFDDIVGSELDGTRVRKGDVIAHVLEKNNLRNRDKILMVGDRKHDVIGAKEQGIDCVGVLYGYGNRKELEEAGADYISKNIEELIQVCQ